MSRACAVRAETSCPCVRASDIENANAFNAALSSIPGRNRAFRQQPLGLVLHSDQLLVDSAPPNAVIPTVRPRIGSWPCGHGGCARRRCARSRGRRGRSHKRSDFTAAVAAAVLRPRGSGSWAVCGSAPISMRARRVNTKAPHRSGPVGTLTAGSASTRAIEHGSVPPARGRTASEQRALRLACENVHVHGRAARGSHSWGRRCGTW